jgi:hypothetical protein
MRGLFALAAGGALLGAAALAQSPPRDLADPKSFDAIADRSQRSAALFGEAGKVILHPRCVNCHPAGDRPLQGADMHLHNPPVVRGPSDIGAAGMGCGTCHLDANTPIVTASIRSVPGNPKWRVAPLVMAWEGKSLGQICQQIKDPARNGGKTLAQLHEHMAKDDLVAWGWAPGEGREPVPGTQERFGEIIQAWIDSGAVCPP